MYYTDNDKLGEDEWPPAIADAARVPLDVDDSEASLLLLPRRLTSHRAHKHQGRRPFPVPWDGGVGWTGGMY